MTQQLGMFEPIFPPELTGDRLRVASLLLDHRGKGKLTSRAIAASLGWHERRAADVRHLIQELIDEYRLELVGDRSDKDGGFRFAESHEEFIRSQMPNLQQAVTTLIRIGGRIGWGRLSREIFRMGGGALTDVLKPIVRRVA